MIQQRSAQVLRAGLLLLAGEALLIGGQALFFPEYFYSSFLLGRGWVKMLPPYNEHITRDLGALYLGFVVLLGYTAVKLSKDLFNGALVAFVIATVPHLFFHSAHRDMAPEVLDQVLQIGALLLTVVVGLVLLALGRRYFAGLGVLNAVPAESPQGLLR